MKTDGTASIAKRKWLCQSNSTRMIASGAVELAKVFADKAILDFGHVCNGSCKDWVEV